MVPYTKSDVVITIFGLAAVGVLVGVILMDSYSAEELPEAEAPEVVAVMPSTTSAPVFTTPARMPTCFEALAVAADVPMDQTVEYALKQAAGLCSSYSDWVGYVRAHGSILGVMDTPSYDEVALMTYTICQGIDTSPLCADARAGGLFMEYDRQMGAAVAG